MRYTQFICADLYIYILLFTFNISKFIHIYTFIHTIRPVWPSGPTDSWWFDQRAEHSTRWQPWLPVPLSIKSTQTAQALPLFGYFRLLKVPVASTVVFPGQCRSIKSKPAQGCSEVVLHCCCQSYSTALAFTVGATTAGQSEEKLNDFKSNLRHYTHELTILG